MVGHFLQRDLLGWKGYSTRWSFGKNSKRLIETLIYMDANSKEERKVIFYELSVYLDFYVCPIFLQSFLVICQSPYFDLLKCDNLTQQIKREAWVIPAVDGPSNVPTHALPLVPVGVMKQWIWPSLMGSVQPQWGTLSVFIYDVYILGDTRGASSTLGILPST